MPTYDYVCHHCGHRFEVIHGLHDTGPRQCPVCHSHEVRKAFAAPAIHFKGSGWAKKDRRATAKPGTTGDTKPTDTPAADATGSGTTSPTATSTGPKETPTKASTTAKTDAG